MVGTQLVHAIAAVALATRYNFLPNIFNNWLLPSLIMEMISTQVKDNDTESTIM